MTAESQPLGLGAPALPAPLHLEQFLGRLLAPRAAITPAQAWLVAAAAVALAVWADVLFYDAGAGLNVPLWVASVVATLVVVGRRVSRPVRVDRLVPLGLAVALASVFAFRDSEALIVFGTLGMLSQLFLGVALPANTGLRRISPVTCAIALAAGLVSLATALWRLAARVPAGRLGRFSGAEVWPVMRAMIIAAPLLLVFGALFFAADAVFAERVDQVFSFDVSTVAHHGRVLGFGLLFASAMLWAAVAVEGPADVAVSLPARYSMRRLEVVIVLGSLAALFALFVVIQVRYLFGGEDAVQQSVDLTYAQYARRGFFELVTASLLLLPVLAGVEWARQRTPEARRASLLLASVLGALLLVIVASAWQRLSMYVGAFGLTELRFYAATTLPWLVVTLGWFFVSVARNRLSEFLAGAMLLAAASLLVQYVIAPDAFIARTNVARAAEGKPFDALYAASLSADAVPTLLAHVDDVPPAECPAFVMGVRRHLERQEDWRAWNWSRVRAASMLERDSALTGCGSQ